MNAVWFVLGNCWLLSAVANLTMKDDIFHHIVPDDQDFDATYAGIFHFRYKKRNIKTWESIYFKSKVKNIMLPRKFSQVISIGNLI